MKTLASIRSGSNPTIISQTKEHIVTILEAEELNAIDDALGLSLMYLSDSIEMIDSVYQIVSGLESTDDETRQTVADLYDTIKTASANIQSKYSIQTPIE
tara:strand:+ start:295 stop:594 length:300 start_codon:yes stop_codon:yes gene_type:complete